MLHRTRTIALYILRICEVGNGLIEKEEVACFTFKHAKGNMGNQVLLREAANYKRKAAAVIEVIMLGMFAVAIISPVFFTEAFATTIIGITFITIGISLFLSRFDIVKNAVTITLSTIGILLVLTLSTIPMFIMHGLSGVKKYWLIQFRYHLRVLMAMSR